MSLGSNWLPSADCCDWIKEMQDSSSLGNVEESESSFKPGCCGKGKVRQKQEK